MSDAERQKWDARYANGAYAERDHPTRLLAAWLPRVPRGRALDVACGAGRNALFLARQGFAVDAIDISRVALDRARQSARESGLEINFAEVDLDDSVPAIPEGPYALIVVVRYVNLTLYATLIDYLAPGGYLISEQHLAGFTNVIGPGNPRFRVSASALRRACANLREQFYHEGVVTDPDGRRAALAQIVAQKSDTVFDRHAG